MEYFEIEFWNYQAHGMLDYQVFEVTSKKLVIPRNALREKSIKRVNR